MQARKARVSLQAGIRRVEAPCKRPLLKSSAYTHVGANAQSLGKEPPEEELGNNPECSHRAGNRVCSYQPERETSQCKGYWVEHVC